MNSREAYQLAMSLYRQSIEEQAQGRTDDAEMSMISADFWSGQSLSLPVEPQSQEELARIAEQIQHEQLEPARLTFAAEEIAELADSDLVRKTLLPLLQHGSAIVREGAIRGLVWHLNEEVRATLAAIAESDPSNGVRTAAEDVLSEE